MNNIKNSQDGFTIIEVVLFLGVSAMLLVGAFVGMTAALNTTQFNDTTDTTQSYFQKKYLEVATGVNARQQGLVCDGTGQISYDASSTFQPGQSNCVVLGRMFSFTPGSSNTSGRIVVRYISSAVPASSVSGSDLAAFGTDRYVPQVANLTQLNETFNLPWSAIVRQATLRTGTTNSGDIRHVAIIRSPVSERMMVYGFTMNDPTVTDFGSTSNLLGHNRTAVLCLQSDANDLFSKKALLTIGSGQGQDLFTIDRDANFSTHCDGVPPTITPPSWGVDP